MNAGLPPTARFIPSDYRLRLPGPAAIPERVRAATALPMLSHRGPEFRGVLDEVTNMVFVIIHRRARPGIRCTRSNDAPGSEVITPMFLSHQVAH